MKKEKDWKVKIKDKSMDYREGYLEGRRDGLEYATQLFSKIIEGIKQIKL